MKKIFKLLLIMLVVMCFVGCDVKTTSDPITKDPSIEDPIIKEHRYDELPYYQITNLNYSTYDARMRVDSGTMKSVNKFAINTMQALVKEKGEKDLFYSPASLYMALSMLTEGADGNSYTELINMLQSESLEDLKYKNSIIYKNNNLNSETAIVKIANSIWVDDNNSINKDYTKTLIEQYYAETYGMVMSEPVLEQIANWINQNTFDFLNVNKDDLKNLLNTVLVLVNTIYFNAQWDEPFYEYSNKQGTFYGTNEVEVTYMNHRSGGYYYDRDKFICASDELTNDYKIYYVLPKDNYTVKDCLNDGLEDVIMGSIRYRLESINFTVPKFNYQNKLDLVPTCKSLGVNDIFNDATCNLSKIKGGIFVSNIDQIAGIDLNENGITAAAATIISAKESCVGDEPIDFVLNKTFLYYIVDSNNTIMFMGICDNPIYK